MNVKFLSSILTIAFLFFLLVLPNFSLLFYSADTKTISSLVKDFFYIFLALILLTLPLVFTRVRLKAFFYSMTFFALIAPFSFQIMLLLGQNAKPDLFLSVLNTNSQEAMEFLGPTAIAIYLLECLFIGGLYIWLIKTKCPNVLFPKNARLILIAGTLFSVSCIIGRDVFLVRYSLTYSLSRLTGHISNTYPFGTLGNLWVAYEKKKEISLRSERLSHFKFNAKKRNSSKEKEVHVLIIGESSRYSNWKINGYSRNTSPHLASIPDLLTFSDVASSALVTHDAVPFMLTRGTARNPALCLNEKSVVTAFKEAGFKTYWLTNHDIYSTSLESYAFEADQFIYTLGYYNIDEKYDGLVLKKLKDLLENVETKSLIVIHTLGSHYIYSYRYPMEFDFFKPSLKGFSIGKFADAELKIPMINSYDNSILYTDFVLSEIIGQIDKLNCISSVLYASDHAENLWDDSRSLFGHGIGEATIYTAHIPQFLWMSSEYKNGRADKYKQAASHVHSPLSAANIFHSLLDMADVTLDNEDLSYSFFSDKLERHERFVKNNQDEIQNYLDLK